MGASARAVKRAKVTGGDAIAFFEPHMPANIAEVASADSCSTAYKPTTQTNCYIPPFISANDPQATSIASGITLDGCRIRTNAIVAANQVLALLIDDVHLGLDDPPFPATQGPIQVIYEDEDILIVDKPANVVMYPGASWHGETTLANYVLGHFEKAGFTCDLHPVHRLDKETSGLVVFAKSAFAQDGLQPQLHTDDFQRTYLALCVGTPPTPQGRIDAPIARLTYSPSTFGIRNDGKHAATHYKKIAEGGGLSLIELKLETGRTHQIRIHMAYIGCPLLGDGTYGKASNIINRAALHSYRLQIAQPIDGRRLQLQTDPPKDFVYAMQYAGIKHPT
jgi:23S rRNA pseudouridine1911/1915/1917 synthase